MTTLEPFENRANFLEDVGLFEAAVHAPPAVLAKVEVKSILVSPDGSNQDDTVRAVGRLLGEALKAPIHERTALATTQDILRATAEVQAGLIVLPVPFGADIGMLQEESLGEVIDCVLAVTTLPVLAVRQPLPDDELASALRHILVPLAPGHPPNVVALAWSCELLKSGGELKMLEVADAEILREARQLLQSAGESSSAQAALERFLNRQFASLVAVVQRTATESGFHVNVASTGERFVERALEVAGEQPTLLVVAGSRDRRSTAFHRAADLILGARFPVLIVE